MDNAIEEAKALKDSYIALQEFGKASIIRSLLMDIEDLKLQNEDLKTAIDLYESNFASLVDALNTELRENGPVGVEQAGVNNDLRPFVCKLVDYIRGRNDKTNKGGTE